MQPNPTLPTLLREDRDRLALFFRHDEDLTALAAKLAADSAASSTDAAATPDEVDLQTWASQPEIAAHIDFRRREFEYRCKKRTLTFLDGLIHTSDNQIEKRRAATTVLRALGLGAQRLPGTGRGIPGASHHRKVSDRTSDDSMPDPVPPSDTTDSSTVVDGTPAGPQFAPLTLDSTPELDQARATYFNTSPTPTPDTCSIPDPSLHPRQVLMIVLKALGGVGGHDSNNLGLITAFNYSGVDDRSAESFDAFSQSLGASFPHIMKSFNPLLHEERQHDDHSYSFSCTLTYPSRNFDGFRFRCRFNRPTEGPLARCWLLTMDPPESPRRDTS